MVIMMSMTKRQYVFAAAVGCAVLVLLFGLTDIAKGQYPRFIPYWKHQQASSFYQTQSRIQAARIANIKHVCSLPRVRDRDRFYYSGHSLYKYSKTYKFAMCKVPKIGSTFWSQAFMVLENGPANAADIFGTRRGEVHRHFERFRIKFKKLSEDQSDVVLMSRDPYSRLYSAYVDKIFLPNNSFHWQAVNSKRAKCPKNTSFQTFLDYVARSDVLDNHWLPVSSTCRPCDVNVTSLIKQKTFSDDVRYVLEKYHAQSDQYRVLMEALHGNRVQYTIPGIVETVFLKVHHNTAFRKCYTKIEVAKLIWKSFQLQGFIKMDIDFPNALDIVQRISTNASSLSEIILETIRGNPMTSSEQKQQRREALVAAYENITQTTIRQIQDIYSLDFELFGYSVEPPMR